MYKILTSIFFLLFNFLALKVGMSCRTSGVKDDGTYLK